MTCFRLLLAQISAEDFFGTADCTDYTDFFLPLMPLISAEDFLKTTDYADCADFQ